MSVTQKKEKKELTHDIHLISSSEMVSILSACIRYCNVLGAHAIVIAPSASVLGGASKDTTFPAATLRATSSPRAGCAFASE
jgi:hypothetical protein